VKLAAGLRAVRIAREKTIWYREWHLQVRTGLVWSKGPSPGTQTAFETALVRLGEESGKLEECVRLLSEYFAAEDRMMRKLLARAAYPMFLVLFSVVFGPLPLVFQGRTGAYLVLAGGALALVALFGGAALMAVLRWYLDQPKYVLGRLLRSLTFAIEAGLPLGKAAQLAADATGDSAVIAHVRSQSRQGGSRPLTATFAGCPHVTAPALAAMEVAEQTGDYDNSLRRLAELTEG
jgi:type II secretory pathway component PulF